MHQFWSFTDFVNFLPGSQFYNAKWQNLHFESFWLQKMYPLFC